MRAWLLLLVVATGCAHVEEREVIAPAGATTIAPYSPAIRIDDLVFLSGQIGMAGGTLVAGGIAAETRQALANVRTILEAASLTPADVVKCTVFLVDMNEYEAMNREYGAFFPTAPPARSAVAVAALPRNARVEIECIARARE
jgi:2-iminobutanoate/2-iminopropanoate deaminase